MQTKNKPWIVIGLYSIVVMSIVLLATGNAQAQKHEFGALIGVASTEDVSLKPSDIKARFDKGATYQFVYARRLTGGGVGAFYFEFLFAATPGRDINSTNILLPKSYSTIFVTPGLKLKLIPGFFLNPYLAGGIGYARLSVSDSLINNQPNTGDKARNSVVVNYGGGIDLKIFPFVSIRGEIRDFITGKPIFSNEIFEDRQHHYHVSIGVVLRF